MSASAESSRSQSRPQRIRRSQLVWHVSRFGLWLFCKLWFRMRMEGRDNIPDDGPVLLVANHASYLDPPLVGITSRREVDFLAQAGLARLGPMRWWLAQVGVTLIDRNAPSKDAMRIIVECLRGGDVVGVFPEGTRSRDGQIHSFKSGVEFLIRRTKATVVPIGIDGNHRAYPPGSILPRPRKVVVRCGEPWSAQQVLADGGVEALRRRIAELARAPLAEVGDDQNGTSGAVGRADPKQSTKSSAGGAA